MDVKRLHLYMGEGKGKTTAAMGLALRAIGHGRRVMVAQFLKSGCSGELIALGQFPLVTIMEMPAFGKFTSQMTAAERTEATASLGLCMGLLQGAILREKPQLIVLDELALAVHLGMVDEAAAHELIDCALSLGEVAITGRYASESLVDRADYVSEICKRAHPFDQGVAAREGVEF